MLAKIKHWSVSIYPLVFEFGDCISIEAATSPWVENGFLHIQHGLDGVTCTSSYNLRELGGYRATPVLYDPAPKVEK